MKNPKPPDAPATGRCLKSADCTCGSHPKPPPADETCLLTRTVDRDGLRLDVWSCSAPEPRPAQGLFKEGMFKRSPPVTAQDLFPGSADSWSCNTPLWPGHLDLVLYRGGPEEAVKTAMAILQVAEKQAAERIRSDRAEATVKADRAAEQKRILERVALATRAREEQRRARATPPARRKQEKKPARVTSIKERIAALLELHRFHRTFIAMVIKRRYRFFHISNAKALSGESPFSEPGWFFDAVSPPASWMSNDAMGPYPTVKLCLQDAFRGDLSEEPEDEMP